jgi:hypothetical protein
MVYRGGAAKSRYENVHRRNSKRIVGNTINDSPMKENAGFAAALPSPARKA